MLTVFSVGGGPRPRRHEGRRFGASDDFYFWGRYCVNAVWFVGRGHNVVRRSGRRSADRASGGEKFFPPDARSADVDTLILVCGARRRCGFGTNKGSSLSCNADPSLSCSDGLLQRGGRRLFLRSGRKNTDSLCDEELSICRLRRSDQHDAMSDEFFVFSALLGAERN